MDKWSRYFIDVAIRTAQLSHCQRLQVGAVAVKDKRIICVGFNGTPEHTDNCCELTDGTTSPNVLHAEENLILYAAKNGIQLKNTTLYITHAPCINCARMAYGAGFDKIFFGVYYRDLSGIEFLENNGVRACHVEMG